MSGHVPKRLPSSWTLAPTVYFPFFNEKKPGVYPELFAEIKDRWRCLKSSLVLSSTLVAGVFLDRLFFSAAERPFFDRFFVWFGSHSSITYSNVNEISPFIF
jgi:hypothetical protein